MTRTVVTGCAGFIGSQIAEACILRGDDVVGIDVLTDYYDPGVKRRNMSALQQHERFAFEHGDLAEIELDLLDGVDTVFHQAGQPGVRSSWRDQFADYLRRNVHATQRLLDASVENNVRRVVYASSSSVYGNAVRYPVAESDLPRPFSPYGVTKLAAEHLCSLYAANFGLSVVSLRYFTVFGPRQRPDMAAHRLFEAALERTRFPLFGSGEQLRDFTFVGDVVRANLLAGGADVEPGLVANVAGGGACSMNELIAMIGDVTGSEIEVARQRVELGDVTRTGGSTDVARTALGWVPETSLREGLERQYQWHLERHR